LIKQRERSRHIPIIFVTAIHTDPGHRLKGYASGAVDYIAKPIDPELLRAKVSGMVSLHQLHCEHAARLAAQHSNRMKDEFLAMVSHELSTPLSAIIGWADRLSQGELAPEKIARGLEVILRNAEVQQRLIGDLLDVSAIVAGRFKLARAPNDLVEIVRSATEAVRPSVADKGLTLDVAVEAARVDAVCDALRIQQVVWNLLGNAIKFTPRGGRVELRLERTDARARLLVRDNGRGIDPEFLPHVFERFMQADPLGTTRAARGLGLGLAIVRRIVELHEGTVVAESAGEGRGATFTVTLPAAA